MSRLLKDSDRKIFLIIDKLRVHHSKIVGQLIEANKEKIELFFLPLYAPKTNPDEDLSGDLKQRIRSGLPARSKKNLPKKPLIHE